MLLMRALASGGLDVYHATWNYGIPLFAPCPTVLTIHDLIPLAMPNYFSSWKGKFLAKPKYWALTMASARKAKSIIADSESSKRDIVRWLRVPASKVQVIYNGIDKSYRPVDDQPIVNRTKAHYGLLGDYIVYVGGLDRRKNISGLLRALRFLASREGFAFQLVIVGEKNFLYPELTALVSVGFVQPMAESLSRARKRHFASLGKHD